MTNARCRGALLVAGLMGAVLFGPFASDSGYAQGRGRGRAVASRQGVVKGQIARGHQEPAYERGYTDGYQRGLANGRRGQRYGPADSREYRSGDQGYSDTYGSRGAYKTNYRAGFRQGYEDGYREATR